MKVFYRIFKIPSLVFEMGYQIYIVYQITKNNDMSVLSEIDSPEELQKHLKPHLDKFHQKYEIILNIFNIITWLTLLKIMFF